MTVLNKELVEIVNNRLILVERLMEAEEYFRREEDILYKRKLGTEGIEHLYKHYDGLISYLALTCFDILGQPSDWLDFGAWMRAKRKLTEREAIFNRYDNLPKEEMLISVYEEYNKMYSVRNSFYRFIRNILSDENRDKLFLCINVGVETSPHNMRSIEPVQHEVKEKFLFRVRNSFTHKGISITGSSIRGLFPEYFFEMQRKAWPEIDLKKEGFYSVYKEKVGETTFVYSVRNWPEVLLEVVRRTIKSNR